MKVWILTDETGRIVASTDVEEFAGGMEPFELPDDFDFSKQDDYRVVDGELASDPRPVSSAQQIEELKSKLASTDYVVVKVSESMAIGQQLSEEDADRYADIIIQRRQWREQINALESEEGGE